MQKNIRIDETERETQQDQIQMSYELELQYLNSVKLGDMNEVQRILKKIAMDRQAVQIGILSTNPVRNMRYHIITSTAMIARYCIEGGMHADMAYHLNEFYIRQADLINDINELQRLNERMTLDFTKRMMAMHKEKVYSKNIVRCIDYIYTHIRDRVTAQELAEFCNLHPSYLSRLFHEEVGIGISEYIRRAKIEKAKNMLKYSEDSYSTIANDLAFSSQSHFVKVFREQTGMTPKAYRDKYYRKGIGNPES